VGNVFQLRKLISDFLKIKKKIIKSRGVQIPWTRWPELLNFVKCRPILGGLSMDSDLCDRFERQEFLNVSEVFVKFYTPKCDYYVRNIESI